MDYRIEPIGEGHIRGFHEYFDLPSHGASVRGLGLT